MVCSAQTLERRNFRPDVDIVIVDECHRRNVHVEQWLDESSQIFIGLSATPWAAGMANHWDALVRPITLGELIAQGYLVPFRVLAPSAPDLSAVRSRRGADGEVDYVETDLAQTMSDPTLVADVVSTWCARAEGRPTIVFAVDRGHAHVLRSQFEQAGVPTGYVDANTPRLERADLARGLSSGDIKVLVNIDVLTAGFDCPAVSCIVLARPTCSEIRYVQSAGRGLRPSPETGKTDLLIIDHSDTTASLGFITDINHDGLDGGTERRSPAHQKPRAALAKKCPSCSFLKPARVNACPVCGFAPEIRHDIRCLEGELVEFDGRRQVKKSSVKFGWLTDDELLGQLQHYGAERQYKPGWASAKFKTLRGKWPPRYVAPQFVRPPVMELRSWIWSETIRWAKSQEARNAQA